MSSSNIRDSSTLISLSELEAQKATARFELEKLKAENRKAEQERKQANALEVAKVKAAAEIQSAEIKQKSGKTKSTKKRNPQSRNYFLQTYVKGERISAVLRQRADQILRYAYIYHDQDKWEEDQIHYDTVMVDSESVEIPMVDHRAGDFKTPHWHILIQLKNPAREAQVKSWFYDPEEGQNTNTQPCDSLRACYMYLTHENAPEKFHYSEMGIVSNDKAYFEHITADSAREDSLTDCVLSLAEGQTTLQILTEHGRDFILNYRNVKAMADAISYEEGMQTAEQELALTVHKLQKRIEALTADNQYLTQKNIALRTAIKCAVDTTTGEIYGND